MSEVSDAARQVAEEIRKSINPANQIDAEVKMLVAASWLTFAELVARRPTTPPPNLSTSEGDDCG